MVSTPAPDAAAITSVGILRIDHVGIAVADLDAAIGFYARVFGMTCVHREENEEQGVCEYERVLQADELPQECRFALRADVLPHWHEHLDTLAAMMSAAAKKG